MHTLASLFAYKAWANAELLACLEGIDARQHSDTLRMALRTVNHTHVVDRLFQARLQDRPPPFADTNTEATPTLGELASGVTETDRWFAAYVATLRPEQLAETVAFTFTDGDAGRMTREEILLHLVTHGAYHRGNVGQLLKGLAIAPPRDLLTRFLHAEPSSRRP